MADKYGGLQTPFEQAGCMPPSGEPTGGDELTGGYDLPGGEKESKNLSGLPEQVTLVKVAGGDSGPHEEAMPPVASPGTFQTSAPKE